MKFINKDYLGKLFLIHWIPLISIVISFQMVNHIASMPLPEDYQKNSDDLPRLRINAGWLIVHVFYEKCSCTNSLTKSLLERGAQPGVEEWVLYTGSGGDLKEKFENKGFFFESETKTSIGERYGIEAAPLLLIFSPKDQLKYGGGYFERPSVFRAMDQSLFTQIKNDESVEALPLYGCAVSTRLEKVFYPFGVKL